MARPQLEDGRTEIANELLEAIIKTHFSPTEHAVLWAVVRKTYGWHKKMDRISFTQLEELTGISRRHIAPALKKLKGRNIITISGAGYNLEYSVQKDYEKWDLDCKYKIKKKKLIMQGYIFRYIGPENPFRSMASEQGYIAEHRLVMAKHLKRLLKTEEIVHHINHERDDNRIENLELTNNTDHYKETQKWTREHQNIVTKTGNEIIANTGNEGVANNGNKSLPELATNNEGEIITNIGTTGTSSSQINPKTGNEIIANTGTHKSNKAINKSIIQKQGAREDKKDDKEIYGLPEYVDASTWDEYLKMRKKRRAAPTDRAIELIIKDLEKYHGEGYDVNKLLEMSIKNSWIGVFPRKEFLHGTHQGSNEKTGASGSFRASINKPLH